MRAALGSSYLDLCLEHCRQEELGHRARGPAGGGDEGVPLRGRDVQDLLVALVGEAERGAAKDANEIMN